MQIRAQTPDVAKPQTMGRRPTVGEMFEYYSRYDICEVLYYQTTRWRILMDHRGGTLLEPGNERDVRKQVHAWLKEFVGDARDSDRLDKYPTMHVLKDRSERAPVRYDFVLEDDPVSWNQAFAEMMQMVDLLEAHNAYYQIKFSGHRSLHLRIPAEAFPKDLLDSNETLNGTLADKIHLFLGKKGHMPPGLRAVYSLHPIGGMASLPLRRDELHLFRPWMANLHTVAVDWDWFEVPKDAAARNEPFLRMLLDEQHRKPTFVSAPPPPPASYVRAYAGEPATSEADIQAGLRSENSLARIRAVRAALTQQMNLEEDTIAQLLNDPDPDVAWFVSEMILDKPLSAKVHLSVCSRHDDYLHATGTDWLKRSETAVADLVEFLLNQTQVSYQSGTAVQLLAAGHWPQLVGLPWHIKAVSFEEWFEKAWVVCASCLCLGWNQNSADIFKEAYSEAARRAPNAESSDEAIRRLKLLFVLRNNIPAKGIRDEVLFDAADALREAGYDLRDIILLLLRRGALWTTHGALRLLTRMWWDDCPDLVVGFLNSGSSLRKGAARALTDMGAPAIGTLLHTLETSRSYRTRATILNVLGEIGDREVIPVIERYTANPDRKLRKAAADVLQRSFRIEVEVEEEERDAMLDAMEVEDR